MLSCVRTPSPLDPLAFSFALLALAVIPLGLPAQSIDPTVTVDSPMAAPGWATAQRDALTRQRR